MKSFKPLLIVLSTVGLVFLGACSNGNQASNLQNSPATSPATSPAETEQSSEGQEAQAGGQVVESGPYHLEFVPVSEANGTHLDFYLQKGDNHEAIPNAKVTAQVQSPDGTQSTLPLTYDAEGKHYTALLPGKTAGKYQVAMITDIKGKKVNGRFTFSQ